MQQDELMELRRDERFTVVACDIQRDPLRRVDRAFKAFFRRVKAGQKPGFPRFRSHCDMNRLASACPQCAATTVFSGAGPMSHSMTPPNACRPA
jgi:hypothetical protein